MQKTLFRNDGRKLEIVDKRVIWDAIKSDSFLAAAAKQWQPVAIEFTNINKQLTWRK